MAFTINGVPIHCINEAAVIYNVPATIIISVLKTENGKIGSASPNTNGTFDFGPMQINSIWLPSLARFGITQSMLQYNPCVNVNVGTWILSQKIAGSPRLWQGVGDYHSTTKIPNQQYRVKVAQIYQLLTAYLNSNEITSHPPVKSYESLSPNSLE